ncbi:MAG TPA: sigma-70 family RNA polymerase sigma factor [Vicinamibacterales bacterium]|nr:sigma-70 family RNA polymerase sigma factor [Vicinamibacterales bacterium]
MRKIVTSIEPGRDAGAAGEESDAELARDMCAKRAEALERIFHRYVRLVTGIAHRILNDRAEAEDVTQEVFLEIYRKAHLYAPSRGSFRVWLLQYVYHRTLRRKAVLRRRAAYGGQPIETLDEPAPDLRPALTRDECRWILNGLFAQLPVNQRITLELTCFEDLPLRDVAARLGVSVGSTRHYYYRGLARLQHSVRVSERRSPAAECHDVSRSGRAGAARRRDPPPYARI